MPLSARLRKKVFDMNEITDQLLHLVSDFTGSFQGAYNIREDGQCAGRQSTKNIRIESKQGLPGLEIHIAPGTKNETVYIPCTEGDECVDWFSCKVIHKFLLLQQHLFGTCNLIEDN